MGKEYPAGEHYPSWIEFMVCMYVYMYVCMYACMNMCIYTSWSHGIVCFQHPHLLQHTYIHTYIHTWIHFYIHSLQMSTHHT